jgi:hypothetical protein
MPRKTHLKRPGTSGSWCGYILDVARITPDISKVTCKICLNRVSDSFVEDNFVDSKDFHIEALTIYEATLYCAYCDGNRAITVEDDDPAEIENRINKIAKKDKWKRVKGKPACGDCAKRLKR